MSTERDGITPPERWLRGPVASVPPLLQPVAHALLQARDEVRTYTADFPETLLWERPAGVASVGFHLQHLHGVLDRLFTYARGRALSPTQLAALQAEGQPKASVEPLVQAFEQQVAEANRICGFEKLQNGRGKTNNRHPFMLPLPPGYQLARKRLRMRGWPERH